MINKAKAILKVKGPAHFGAFPDRICCTHSGSEWIRASHSNISISIPFDGFCENDARPKAIGTTAYK
jgi:hypothetical protein